MTTVGGQGVEVLDSGHQAVGHALLISGVAIGALTAAQLAEVVIRPLSTLITALQ